MMRRRHFLAIFAAVFALVLVLTTVSAMWAGSSSVRSIQNAGGYTRTDHQGVIRSSAQYWSESLKGLRIRHFGFKNSDVTSVRFRENSRLTNDILKLLLDLPRLRKLDVSDTPFNDEGMRIISKSDSVMWLSMNNTDVSDEGITFLQNSGIIVLDANGTAISDKSVEFLRKTHIGSLSFNRTFITDIGLEEIAKIPDLDYLSLASTSITDEGLLQLKQAKRLHRLVVTNTAVTKEGVEELQKSIPSCRIDW